ncbi:MAG: PIG-L family deacetylase [Lentimicrobiaceae bacterium]|jgi:LmbE family N-acetylglucosaminyl deacetylase|nr:PIG-L family deacetylase [Lentimicrobiaceae bacterium]
MFKKILVLAPHTDDGELGCGGTIAKFIEEGKEVFCAAFSIAEDSVPMGFPRDILSTEFTQAMQVLGLKKENIIIFKFKVRNFPQYRQGIIEKIIKLQQKINPDLVFIPSKNDIHQDHQVIANEGLRVFKKVSILGYEMPWNNIIFETRCFVKLEERHIQKKLEALNSYNTQKHRKYLNNDFIYGLAKTRGTQFENDWAEAFEVVRLVIE